jgi:hypothetical protein
LSGTLFVSDGFHTGHLTLLAQYVTAQFIKATDGHGGTLIGISGGTGNGPLLGGSTIIAANDESPLLAVAQTQVAHWGVGKEASGVRSESKLNAWVSVFQIC